MRQDFDHSNHSNEGETTTGFTASHTLC